MTREIEILIKKIVLRDIELKLLAINGDPTKTRTLEILKELENEYEKN